MGAIRSKPERQVHVSGNSLFGVSFVSASVCGWQYSMEDRIISLQLQDKVNAFCVIDGHGGPEIAEYCARKITRILSKSELIKVGQYYAALESLFSTLDESILRDSSEINEIRRSYGLPVLGSETSHAGCSLVLALVSQDQIVIGNIGECKCYVSYRQSQSKAVLISGNHTQSNQEERQRVIDAGGYFINGKVNGILPITRSIGDLPLKGVASADKSKQLIVSIPSLFSLHRNDVRLLVLGSGGIWQRPEAVLGQVAEKDIEVSELEAKVAHLLETMVPLTSLQAKHGLQNMAITVVEIQ